MDTRGGAAGGSSGAGARSAPSLGNRFPEQVVDEDDMLPRSPESSEDDGPAGGGGPDDAIDMCSDFGGMVTDTEDDEERKAAIWTGIRGSGSGAGMVSVASSSNGRSPGSRSDQVRRRGTRNMYHERLLTGSAHPARLARFLRHGRPNPRAGPGSERVSDINHCASGVLVTHSQSRSYGRSVRAVRHSIQAARRVTGSALARQPRLTTLDAHHRDISLNTSTTANLPAKPTQQRQWLVPPPHLNSFSERSAVFFFFFFV